MVDENSAFKTTSMGGVVEERGRRVCDKAGSRVHKTRPEPDGRLMVAREPSGSAGRSSGTNISLGGGSAASDARAWIVLGMLCFVYVLNFLDRSLLSILAKPIEDSLHISDGQLGLLGGLYFALFYCFIAVPVGWFADRTNRVTVLSLACALWSAATAACGLAANYGQLILGRMAVGVGEAGGVPPSYALITDFFPPGRRGMAL